MRSLFDWFRARFGARPPKEEPPRGGFAARQGLWGEREAEKALVRQGMKVIARRRKVGRDELDLVMEEGAGADRMIVFVEVKTRSSTAFGGGLAALDARKRHALCRAAARYMRGLPPAPFRIDLVEVYGSVDRGEPDRIEHQKAAVPLERRFVVEGLRARKKRR